ncbi:MAG: DNA-protecting protein DprA [Pseudonocardiales bacterium]|nr:DNA-processing protein DprA [Actinomycetota bacterium]PZS22500.1 MAG: DNA-protecting protein DprA [Pseudonocardiales bacterium]
MTPGQRELRQARAYLSRVAESPAPALSELISGAGPVRAARLVAAGQVSHRVVAETGARRADDRAEADLSAVAALGGRLVIPEDDEWPAEAFTCFATPTAQADDRWRTPVALWVRGGGRLAELSDRAVAVVGARAATGYGEHVAAEFGYELAESGFAVVSGAAFGIDGAAHRGALAADGRTVAVQACGLDRPYPAGHHRLLDRIAEDGAVVSEYPPGVWPARHRFLVRNRLIAAFAAGTVVVEAGVRSGARRTATAAAALGRVVMAVPGPVTSALSVGCHLLVRDEQAVLVTRVAEVVEAVGRIGADLAPPLGTSRRHTDGLSPEVMAVYEALPARAPRHPEQLVRESGVPLARVRSALPLLELQGLVGCGVSGWHRVLPDNDL